MRRSTKMIPIENDIQSLRSRVNKQLDKSSEVSLPRARVILGEQGSFQLGTYALVCFVWFVW